MRGRPDPQTRLFDSINVESRIRPNHPLRPLKRRVEAILRSMDELFSQAYDRGGRPSIPPERLLKAILLMALDSMRGERQLCERIDTDLLFRLGQDHCRSEPQSLGWTLEASARLRRCHFGVQFTATNEIPANLMDAEEDTASTTTQNRSPGRSNDNSKRPGTEFRTPKMMIQRR